MLTIKGRSRDKLLFTYDVEVPPQVNKDSWFVYAIELGAFITVCVMAGTILLSIILDLIFFKRYRYHALWQAVEVWQ